MNKIDSSGLRWRVPKGFPEVLPRETYLRLNVFFCLFKSVSFGMWSDLIVQILRVIYFYMQTNFIYLLRLYFLQYL